MALAICRIKKLKSWGDLGGSALHTTRERVTPNADPSVDNIRLIGGRDDPNLETMVKASIGNQKIRKNAVLAVEMLLSASAEYFRPNDPSKAGVYDQKRLDDFTTASTKWLQEQYKNKVIRAELHLDEATPHIHAYIVPLDERGKLSCWALFGGSRDRLSSLQDSFAAAVKHLGIERGIKGSIATHTEVKDYYADVNRDSLDLDLEQQLPQPTHKEDAQKYRERVKEALQPTLDIINHQLSHRQLALKQKEDAQQKALASERERQKLEKRVKELEKEVRQWKQQADQLRDLPLEDVAYNLGLEQDFKDKKWRGQGHIISISGSKFYDFSGEQQGGGGAIDLVMHVLSCEFKQAVVWLSDRFGESGMLQAVTHASRTQAVGIAQTEPAPSFVQPVPSESRWQAVQHYLTKERKLPLDLVKALHTSGLIYADDRLNAVFIQRNLDGETTGAFLRGTVGRDNTFIGLAPGTKRSSGWFYVKIGGSETDLIQKAVLTKSPIDALSKAVLDQPPKSRTLYLAADSALALPLDFLRKVPTVIAAYDNDTAGNETAKQIKHLLPQATRVRPKAKDWNEELKRIRQQELERIRQESERQ
jgi:hypothetical protein